MRKYQPDERVFEKLRNDKGIVREGTVSKTGPTRTIIHWDDGTREEVNTKSYRIGKMCELESWLIFNDNYEKMQLAMGYYDRVGELLFLANKNHKTCMSSNWRLILEALESVKNELELRT